MKNSEAFIGATIQIKDIDKIDGFKGNQESFSLWCKMVKPKELFSKRDEFRIEHLVQKTSEWHAVFSSPKFTESYFITPLSNCVNFHKQFLI